MAKNSKQPEYAQVGWIRNHAGVHPILALFEENHIVGGPEGTQAFGYAVYVRQDHAAQAIFRLKILSQDNPEYKIEVFEKPGVGPTTYPEGVTRTISISGDGSTTVSVQLGRREKGDRADPRTPGPDI